MSAADRPTFAPGLFQDRVVLVTGGTGGIGLACAEAFQRLGAEVIATGATDVEVERARASAIDRGIRFERLDVRDRAAIQTLVSGAPRLDVIVNAAGIIRRDDEHDPDVFANVVAINLTGTMEVCTAARPKLRESGVRG